VAFTLCSIATEFIKNYVGYLRPIFFDQCNPDENYETCLGRHDEYDYFEVKELSKSFISGHASFAFCGGVLFTLFLERTIGVSSIQVAITQQLPNGTSAVAMAYRQPLGLRKVGSILALLPMGLSIFVACSRIVDNVHHPADVVGGSVLGASIAYYCFPLW
jgi:diacylglycerol diphosphate phosphatase / phosphatidate phosphatase